MLVTQTYQCDERAPPGELLHDGCDVRWPRPPWGRAIPGWVHASGHLEVSSPSAGGAESDEACQVDPPQGGVALRQAEGEGGAAPSAAAARQGHIGCVAGDGASL